MPYRNDSAYYSLRAAEERLRGDRADSPAAAAVHYDLAFRYSSLASEDRPKPKLTLVEGGAMSPAAAGNPCPSDPQLSPEGRSDSERELVSVEVR